MRDSKAVELSESNVELLGRYRAAVAAIKLWEAEKEYCKSRLIDCLQVSPGDWAPLGTINGKPAIHYTRYESSRVDLKAMRRQAPGVADQFIHVGMHFRFTVEDT